MLCFTACSVCQSGWCAMGLSRHGMLQKKVQHHSIRLRYMYRHAWPQSEQVFRRTECARQLYMCSMGLNYRHVILISTHFCLILCLVTNPSFSHPGCKTTCPVHKTHVLQVFLTALEGRMFSHVPCPGSVARWSW